MKSKTILFCALLLLLAPWPVAAIEVTQLEGSAHGFPSMLDANGKKLADGEFSQELEDGRLTITLKYRFKRGGLRTEEKTVFRQKSELVQEKWSWRQLKDGDVIREYAVDFETQTATAKKLEKGEMKNWSEKIEVKPGQTFVGYGFMLAVQNLRDRLVHGEAVELQAIGFTPQPKVVGVKITHGGVDQMEMADRELTGDRFVLHPEIPAIAKLFITAPDTTIWLTKAPAEFLRFEGPLMEPNDPIVRVDLLSGDESGPAKPVEKSETR